MSTLCSLMFFTAISWAEPVETGLSEARLHELLQHEDWRIRHDAGLAITSKTQPEINRTIHQLKPVPTRAGTPRFHSDLLSDPAAAWAVAERLLRGQDSAEIRSALATAHARIPQSDDGPLLYIVRHDESALVRSSAVAGLARHSQKAGLDAIRMGLGDSHARVRATAVSSAGYRADGAELQENLIGALSDSDSQVRAQAARVLGWLEIAVAFEPLRSLLADSSAEVRMHALRAMRTIDPQQTQSLPELEQLAKNPDERMRAILETLRIP